MSKEESRQEWEKRVERWSNSGLSKQAWCRAEGIQYKTFLYWTKKLSQEGETKGSDEAAARFVPILPEEDMSGEENVIVVRLEKQSMSIEVKKGFNAGMLASLVEVLKPLC